MFYKRFEELCRATGRSPCAVTVAAGMSKSNVTQWKNGMSPTLSTVEKLANQLGVPAAAFLPEDEGVDRGTIR